MSRPRATTDSFAITGANDPSDDTQPAMESVGGRLRREREAQQISEKEAANTLRLMVTDLRAIEADCYSASANDDVLRNHLRAYANLLKLDSDSILALYDREAGTRLHRGASRIDDIPRANTTTGGSLLTSGLVVMTVVLGILVVVQFTNTQRVIALLAEHNDNHGVNPQQIGSGNVAASTVADSGLTPATTVTESDVVPAATENNRDAVNDDANSLAKITDENAEREAAGAVTEVEAAYRSDGSAGVTADAADMKATDELSFRFAKDCWVEVYDANEKRLIAEVRKAGSSLQLSGKSPFRVLVGYSREVVLQFNNQPVDIEKIDRSYSTLFTVGRTNNDPEAPVVKTIRRKVQAFPTADPIEIASEHTPAQN